MPVRVPADVEQRVREIIVEKGMLEVSVEKVQMDTSLTEGDLALDSVQTLEILVGLEEEFDFFFDDDDITPQLFDKVRNLVGYIKGKMMEGNFESTSDLQPTLRN